MEAPIVCEERSFRRHQAHPAKHALRMGCKACVAAPIKEIVMLYTHQNARGADVYDMDSKQKLAKVVEVNTRAGWVKVQREPPLIDPRGKALVCDRIRFRSIYAIRGLESMPCLFHCYGRLP